MTMTIDLPHEIERQIREQAARGHADAVRHLLIAALGPTVEALIRRYTLSPLSDPAFEALADQLADVFLAYVGPACPSLSDYAVSREGLYEDHL